MVSFYELIINVLNSRMPSLNSRNNNPLILLMVAPCVFLPIWTKESQPGIEGTLSNTVLSKGLHQVNFE
jgi:hypothetical protein